MKPILFNAEMVRAIQNGTKTATRRVVTPRYLDSVFEMFRGELCEASPDKPPIDNGGWDNHPFVRRFVPCKPPCRPGDILYVRETFQIDYLSNIPGFGRIHYKADDTYSDFTFAPERYEMMRRAQLKPGWRPNENMPREAARIFLRVTDVKVQRVQDIMDSGIFAEGIRQGGWPPHGTLQWRHAQRADYAKLWDKLYAKPKPVKVKGVIHHYESYPWEDIREIRTYRGKPWYVIGNPWTWRIEFEWRGPQKGDGHGD